MPWAAVDAAVPEAFPDVGGLSENVAMSTPISESTITGATQIISEPREPARRRRRLAPRGGLATVGSVTVDGWLP